MSAKLAPCPFCGCEDIRFGQEGDFDNWFANCGDWDNCGAIIEFPTQEQTATAWNRRTQLWHPVEETLPEFYKLILAYSTKVRSYSLAYRFPGGSQSWVWRNENHEMQLDGDITHWTPLLAFEEASDG